MCFLFVSLLGFRLTLFGQNDTPLLDLLTAQLPSNRLTVAMVPLENATGDPALDYWRFVAGSLLGPQLTEVKGMRLLPQTSLKYGLAQLHKRQGEALEPGEARRLGELIEAQRIVWGSYQRGQGKWQLSLQVLNVAQGTVSKNLAASSTDCFDLRDKLTKKILKEIGLTPTSAERRKMKRRWTKSGSVVEALGRARLAFEEQRPAAEWERLIRPAIETDPRCAETWAVLALCIGTQGKIEEALAAARQAVRLNADVAMGQAALGQVLVAAERSSEAEEALEHAILLDSDNPAHFGRLAECCMIAKELRDAIAYFERALQLSPFQASVHANLGRAYLLLGERERGLAELKEAERLIFEPDLNTEEFLAWGYERLNNAPAAISHYEQALAIARRVGLNPERIQMLLHDLEQLKAALVPVFVNIRPPKEYTEESLTEALSERLAPEELQSVVRPLAATPEMNSQAAGLTHGATNDLEKARLLFEALAGHLDVGEHEMLTASQTYSAWKAHKGSFGCQEYALLYTMMARAAGLRAHFVTVSKACDGEAVSHACAAVFVGDKALLVDPGYRWFGIPHKNFEVRNDLEATADYLSQLGVDIGFRRIAVKLDPDSAFTHFRLATKYIGKGEWEAARRELPEMARVDSAGAMAKCLKAFLALHDKKPDEAVEFANDALERGWPAHDSTIHLILGNAYYQQRKMKEARTAFRAALGRSPDSAAARRAIARINEIIGAD